MIKILTAFVLTLFLSPSNLCCFPQTTGSPPSSECSVAMMVCSSVLDEHLGYTTSCMYLYECRPEGIFHPFPDYPKEDSSSGGTSGPITSCFFDIPPDTWLTCPSRISIFKNPDFVIHFSVDNHPEIVTDSPNEASFSFNQPGIYTVRCMPEDDTCIARRSFRVYVVSLRILNVDLPEDRIRLELLPQGLSGRLELLVTAESCEYQLFNANRSGQNSPQDFSFNIPSLPVDKYHNVIAKWCFSNITVSDLRAYFFQVMGDYRHTRYFIPDSSACSGSPVTTDYLTGTCTTVTSTTPNFMTVPDSWFTEAYTNAGTGYIPGQGFFSREWTFIQHATFRKVPRPCVSCPGMIVSENGTAAIAPGNISELNCGDVVFVYLPKLYTQRDKGPVVTITDTGTKVQKYQLDHYGGITGCASPNRTTLSESAKTIRIPAGGR